MQPDRDSTVLVELPPDADRGIVMQNLAGALGMKRVPVKGMQIVDTGIAIVTTVSADQVRAALTQSDFPALASVQAS